MASTKFCCICSNPFSDPLLLPCLHFFCKSCLDTQQSENEGILTCPSCYETTTCQPSQLPRHLRIEREASLLKVQQQTSNETICGSCEGQNKLEAYCEDCALPICSDCINVHKKMKSHNIVPFGSEADKLMPVVMCSQHSNETIKYYCIDCKTLVCSKCIIDHKEHNWERINEAFKREKTELQSLLPKAEEAISPILEAAVDAINSIIENTNDTRVRLKRKINEKFDEITETVKKRQDSLLCEVDGSSIAKTTLLDIQKEGLEKIKNGLQLVLETGTAACDEYVDVEFLAIKDYIQRAFDTHIEESHSVNLQPECRDNLILHLDDNFILESISNVGNVCPEFCSMPPIIVLPFKSSTFAVSPPRSIGDNFKVDTESEFDNTDSSSDESVPQDTDNLPEKDSIDSDFDASERF